jgi:hypothetical protein
LGKMAEFSIGDSGVYYCINKIHISKWSIEHNFELRVLLRVLSSGT